MAVIHLLGCCFAQGIHHSHHLRLVGVERLGAAGDPSFSGTPSTMYVSPLWLWLLRITRKVFRAAPATSRCAAVLSLSLSLSLSLAVKVSGGSVAVRLHFFFRDHCSLFCCCKSPPSSTVPPDHNRSSTWGRVSLSAVLKASVQFRLGLAARRPPNSGAQSNLPFCSKIPFVQKMGNLMKGSDWRPEKNRRSVERLERALPEIFPTQVMVHAHARPLVPPPPRLAIASYWRAQF